MQDFERSFNLLREHPDRDLIMYMTSLSVKNPHLADNIASLICLRTIDYALPITYKLPLFYLIDSIIKETFRSGIDAFVLAFNYHLGNTFVQAFQTLSDRDRAKIDFLLGTWEDRKVLQPELLRRMRDEVAKRLPTSIPVTQIDQSLTRRPPVGATAGPIPRHYPPVAVTPGHPNAFPYAAAGIDTTHYPVAHGGYSHDSSFHTPEVDVYRPQAHATYPYQDPRALPLPTVNPTVALAPTVNYQGKRLPDDAGLDSHGRVTRPRYQEPIRTSSVPSNAWESQVTRQMEEILQPMLAELGGHMTLPELYQSNYELYMGIRQAAEDQVRQQQQPPSQYRPADQLLQASGISSSSSSSSGGFVVPSVDKVLATGAIPPVAIYHQNPPTNIEVGFIGNHPVVVDIDRADTLVKTLEQDDSTLTGTIIPPHLSAASVKIAKQLHTYLTSPTPSLPPILFGPLPLEPSKEFLRRMQISSAAEVAASLPSAAKQKKPIPQFRTDNLHQRQDSVIRALYRDFIAEDGQRFSNREEFIKHQSVLVKAKLDRMRLEREGKYVEDRKTRTWYPPVKLWTPSSSGSNGPRSDSIGSGRAADSSGIPGTKETHHHDSEDKRTTASTNATAKEYIVPADEHFVRCPISKETFEKSWDDEEGDWMYRNAVKVLVTEAANKHVYDVGQPTSVEGIKYVVVRKPLIVDGWLATGQAAPFQEAIQRYQAMGKDPVRIVQLENAANQEIGNMEDFFVMLELVAN